MNQRWRQVWPHNPYFTGDELPHLVEPPLPESRKLLTGGDFFRDEDEIMLDRLDQSQGGGGLLFSGLSMDCCL